MNNYKGIDQQEIKCCDTKPGTIQAGISFDYDGETPMLRFHFLEVVQRFPREIVHQATKTMHLMRKEGQKAIVFRFDRDNWTKTYKTRFIRNLAFLWHRITI